MSNQTTAKRADTRRRLIGVVISAKAVKTISVKVERKVRHPKYGKIYSVSKKYLVHDETSQAHVGDLVEIAETRPISTSKRWRFVKIITPALQS